MKISIVTPDVSSNCIGRAWLLARLLQRRFSVEMIGPVFGKGIWKPFENLCDFEIKTVKGYGDGRFELKKMLNMISGDVIYASKPLMTSFGVALIKKIGSGKPLVLDIDDWELGFGKEFYDSLIWYKKLNDFRLSILDWRSYYYAIILDKFIRFANAITVSSNVLHSKYGGTVVWHGRDVYALNPHKFSKMTLRKRYLPEKSRDLFVVSFIGTPRPHKGLEDLIDAMGLIGHEGFLLMIVGSDDGSYCKSLKKRAMDSNLEGRVVLFPEQSFNNLPEFLTIADLVVIPQRGRAASYAQIPAKIFDAMAMAKPIIASNVSDIADILGGCGWIVEPDNPKQLAETIKFVSNNPDEAKEAGDKAREKCIREYSLEIIENSLVKIFEKYIQKQVIIS